MAKSEKYKLEFNIEDEADEYEIIGICSHVPIHQIIWDINRKLKFRLKMSEKPLEIHRKKNQVFEFPYFLDYGREEDYMEIYLVQNKSQGNLLIPELAQIDYFLFLVNNQIYNLNDIHKKIKDQCTYASAAFIFEPAAYESINQIFFEKNEEN